jgi:hypothetical protein
LLLSFLSLLSLLSLLSVLFLLFLLFLTERRWIRVPLGPFQAA